MRSTIYLYINEKDISELNIFFQQHNITFCNSKMEKIEELPFISEGFARYYLMNETDIVMEYSSCRFMVGRLQPATICYDSQICNNRRLFTSLKNHIRKYYEISTNKLCYVGPNMKQDWKDRKYCFPEILFYSEVRIENDKLRGIFEEILEKGFEIKANHVRLRNIDQVDFTERSYIVFSKESNIIRTILRKNIVFYEYGSECLFGEYDDKKKTYIFFLDQRLVDENKQKLIELFETIREKIN